LRRIIFTVTNDLCFDQRMIRICRTLQKDGDQVTLIGRVTKDSLPLKSEEFRQSRLYVPFESGPLFYITFNFRLFFHLLFCRADIICAVDLDTVLPVWLIGRIRGIIMVFDSHEWFCEMKELQDRPVVRRIWKGIERMTIPSFKHGYTVSEGIVDRFRIEYGHTYALIRNIPSLRPMIREVTKPAPFILYQGAVNEGRCFERLIPAMQWVNTPLHIYGDGNYMSQVRQLIEKFGLEKKVLLKGKLYPDALSDITPTACIGISLFDETSLHNRLSLANRFFDFIHAGIPQICSDFPAYREINDRYSVALLISETSPMNIALALNKLLNDGLMYAHMQSQCRLAARELNWQHEGERLKDFYRSLNP
jgi:glycosyltransferase involved in cell wall biosynthesis